MLDARCRAARLPVQFWNGYNREFSLLPRASGTGRSSNGRTSASGAGYRGSNPCLPANSFEALDTRHNTNISKYVCAAIATLSGGGSFATTHDSIANPALDNSRNRLKPDGYNPTHSNVVTTARHPPRPARSQPRALCALAASLRSTAGYWEPDELRGSRPVLGERGGATPPRHSTRLPRRICL
jgi:hypothetical protein